MGPGVGKVQLSIVSIGRGEGCGSEDSISYVHIRGGWGLLWGDREGSIACHQFCIGVQVDLRFSSREFKTDIISGCKGSRTSSLQNSTPSGGKSTAYPFVMDQRNKT